MLFGRLIFSDYLHKSLNRTHEIAVNTLAEALFEFLTRVLERDLGRAAEAVREDWMRSGQALPRFLDATNPPAARSPELPSRAKRQARHAGAA